MPNFYEVVTDLPDHEAVRAKIWERSIPEPNSGCWLWLGATKGRGYGHLCIGGKYVGAHRASFIGHHGPLGASERALHACDNVICVNPDHLKRGTSAQNTADCISRGRLRPGHNGRSKPALTLEQRTSILALPRVRGAAVALAKQLGVSEQTISRIRNGR